jgi:Fic family protein
VNGDIQQVLESVDALRSAWKDVVSNASPDEFAESRERSLRRHAIETGIIERLYDVEWGVTEALVAEGLTADAAAREGGIDDGALATIRSQFEGLAFLAEEARRGKEPSLFFIRQLHQLLCRRQLTYEARNDLGQVLQIPLHHGEWKTQSNHVHRPDGRLLEYAPPEQVQGQLEHLLSYYQQSADLHPVTRAAWLHHAFITIHPFADGNGRVARALTLLVLLSSHYAPLVVDRFTRSDYLEALDRANDGDLRDLVRLFARLEIVALRSELERPAKRAAAGTGAVDVARAYAERLRVLHDTRNVSKASQTERLGHELNRRAQEYLQALGEDIRQQFSTVDRTAEAQVFAAGPGDPNAGYWRAQIIRAANNADFFVNLARGTWWSHLRLRVLGQVLRFVTVVQKVGHGETGVLALTVFAESVPPAPEPGDEPRPLPAPLLDITDAETATFVYTDNPEDRWEEVAGLLDRTLAAAVAEFAQGLD